MAKVETSTKQLTKIVGNKLSEEETNEKDLDNKNINKEIAEMNELNNKKT